MTISYTLTQQEYQYFITHKDEPGALDRYTFANLKYLSSADMAKLKRIVQIPFNTVKIAVSNNIIASITINK